MEKALNLSLRGSSYKIEPNFAKVRSQQPLPKSFLNEAYSLFGKNFLINASCST